MGDDLDRVLGDEPHLPRAPGFAAEVMERVRREERATRPLEFPWRRLAVGVGLNGGIAAVIAARAPAVDVDRAALASIGADLFGHGLGCPLLGALASILVLQAAIRR